MSQLIFNSYIDMLVDAATPSTIGYTIGYDTDGILKQKDQNGTVTIVGAVSTQTLSETLGYGGNSGTYSLIMGTGTFIKSSNGTGIISLDNGSTSSVYISVTSSNVTSSISNSLSNVSLSFDNSTSINSILLSDNSIVTQAGTSTYSVNINQSGDNLSITHNDSNIGSGGTIKVFETGKTYDGLGSDNKAFVHINTNGATTSIGVQNSVVIGGVSLTASESNTVYLGNNVNINNAYTLPNTTGLVDQVLTSNGSGTASWSTFSVVGLPLSDILSVGNDSSTYSIVMGSGSSITFGTSSFIKSDINTNQIDLNYNGVESSILLSTDNGINNQTFLQIASSSTYLKTEELTMLLGSATVTTTDTFGIKYSSDYSSTFVDESLVTKRYVDNNTTTYLKSKIAYVDVDNGDNLTALVDRLDKPYADVSSALLGLTTSYVSFTENEPGLIHIRKGLYSELINLNDYIDYYCEDGVVFNDNGFTDSSSSVTSNVYGKAKFIGTSISLKPLSINNTSVVNFEFDKIDIKSSCISIKGSSIVNISGNYIKTLSESGYGISVEDSSTTNLNIKNSILGAYQTIYVKTGFSGNLNIETPFIFVNGDLGSSGVQSGLVNSLKVDNVTTGTVNIKSSLENISSIFGGGGNSSAHIGSGNITINGRLIGNTSNGLYLDSGNTGIVTINGDIISNIESIIGLNDNIDLRVNNSVIKTNGIGTYPNAIYINSVGTFYINNSTIYNTVSDSTIINVQNINTSLFIYNSLGYSPGTTGVFIDSTSAFVVGIHNTRSSNDNNINITDSFVPSGFIYDPNLLIPNY